ncbi:MAG TPA: flagellar basal body-associated FliL family protein [Verrucomicrobiae bacterium]|jgi:flagellar FliL protein|nr:flagellar basal body-associated FliL family protein [Verrucomicrobiae bacterium]
MAEKPDSAPAKETKEGEETKPAVAPAASGGIKAWLPLIVIILLMPALAYAMTTFVLLPRLQKGLGITPVATTKAAAATDKKADPNAKRETIVMNKLLVNVAGTMGARYLLVSLSVASSDPAFKDKMAEHDAQLRDMAQSALATKTLADLEKPDARNLIRTELMNGFNTIFGGPVAEEIYLTEFAIQ